ncbi:hypothetical protein GCM10028796_52590 [Ramlibacter monticola]
MRRGGWGRPGLVLGLACCAAGAGAQHAAGATGEVAAGVVHRRLVERADDGRRLVTESGELLRLQAQGELELARGGALRASAGIAAGGLDYRGQTQAGVPLDTDSGHRDLEFGFAWRPLAPAPWGEGWLGLHGLQQRRQIASTPSAQGLRETSSLLLAGVRWSHVFDGAGWRWQPSAEFRGSVRHRLEVDFHGVFDTADLKGGGRRELLLGLDASPAGSPWHFGFAWTRARQSASPVQPLLRAGAPAGTVRQPRIEIDDVMLRAGLSF